MKILQVNCVYGNGSTGKITSVLHKELLANEIESIVCYGRGDKTTDTNVYKICSELYSKANNFFSRVSGVMYGGCFNSTRRLLTLIEKEQPDLVHLQCINGYFVNIYALLEYLKKNNIATVLTLHAEFMYTGGCGYAFDCEKWKDIPGCGNCSNWKMETKSVFRDRTRCMWEKMYNVFDGFENLMVVSVSPWLMDRAKESSILKNKKHCVIYNGLDTNIFHEYEIIGRKKKRIFHASPSFCDNPEHMKGGYYVFELARRMPEVEFFVAGPYQISGEIPQNVKMLGRISDQYELAKYYSEADVTLLTSKRETFSMICAESLCCGTPVIGFKAGAPEQISLSEYSEFVEYGNVDELAIVAQKWLEKSCLGDISQKARLRYAKETMAQNYIEVYKEMI